MSYKELIKKLLNGETLQNPEEVAELENFDPDALHEELETIKKQHAQLLRSDKIRQIADNSGCLDKDYLDFRAERAGINLDDTEAVKSFIAEVTASNPGCFKAKIQPGTCKTQAPKVDAEKPVNDRISQIIDFLSDAPSVQ